MYACMYVYTYTVKSIATNYRILNSTSPSIKKSSREFELNSLTIHYVLCMYVCMYVLYVFTFGYEQESMLCGQPEVDLEVLKKATVYEAVSPTDRCSLFMS